MMRSGASRRTAAALAATALLLMSGCSGAQVQRKDNGDQTGYVSGSGSGTVTTIDPAERKAAPAFDGPTLDGGQFSLAASKGTVVVLNVWGSWCPPCRAEAAGLGQAARDLAPAGVQFVGINTRDNTEGAQEFVQKFKVDYPSVVDQDGVRLLAFRNNLPPAAIPSTLVVDRSGRLAARIIGPISEGSLKDLVQQVADEN